MTSEREKSVTSLMRAHYLPLERTIAAGLPSALPQSAHFQKKEEKRRKKKKKEEEEEKEGRGGGKRIPVSEARAACEPSVQREAASANDHCHVGKRLSLHARIEAENNRHPYIQRKKQKCACSCFSKNR